MKTVIHTSNNNYHEESSQFAHPPKSLITYEDPIFIGEKLADLQYLQNQTISNQDNAGKLDDMLNSMLPPRQWSEESGLWMQYISKQLASRIDVITLQEQLDIELKLRKALESDICPVREELYSQCFDELIRHVALDSPERGLILMRVRDELRMTLDAYKTLHSSSVAFGIKKQILSEDGLPELEEQIQKYELENANLEIEVQELRSKLELQEKRETEKKISEDKRRKEELDFLRYQGQHLDTFLKQMNAK